MGLLWGSEKGFHRKGRYGREGKIKRLNLPLICADER
jgi:hypothetical protein